MINVSSELLPLEAMATGATIGGGITGGIGYLIGFDVSDTVGFASLGSLMGAFIAFDVYVNLVNDIDVDPFFNGKSDSI